MKKCKKIPFSLFFLLLPGLISPHQVYSKELFSDNWSFVRIDSHMRNYVKKKTVQTGKSWETQFNIESEDSDGEDKIPTEIFRKEWKILKQKKWQTVNLPHCAYIEPLVVLKPWQGISYYKKSFFISQKEKQLNIFLHFKGVMQSADVWINKKYAFHHSGGYTPFEILLNPFLKFGKSNEIIVRADNSDNSLIPPGKPSGSLDFNYYSGIYRDVYLIKKNEVYIPDPVSCDLPAAGGVFVSFPEVSVKMAVVRIKTTIKNSGKNSFDLRLIQTIRDNKGKYISGETSVIKISPNETKIEIGRIFVANPHLWNIDDPFLYTLETGIEWRGKTFDSVKTRIGIRSIKFSRERGFELNGKRVKLIGCNRHQEYPYIGNALSDNAQYRDMVKIKNGGFNIVRLGHYPQDPSVLDACDELGILAIEPIPGWQYFNKNRIFVKRSFKDIKDMIRRDRNHPSIVLWETVLNESRLPLWWKKKAFEIAHREYPGDQCFTSGDMYGTYIWDVLYNDWHEDFTRPDNSNKPGFIREYGDYEFGGDKSTTRQRRGDGEEKLLQSVWNFQWSLNKYSSYYPHTSGSAIWEMFDHNRGCCPTISASGASDIFRIPKFTYFFFRSQLDAGRRVANGTMKPEVYIANYWMKGSSKKKVIVFGNVDEVELSVNGKIIGRKIPDNGPDTPYFFKGESPFFGGHPFDSGNCRHLNHPPFTFNKVNREEGELKATGYIKKVKVSDFKVRTPGKVSQIKISVDFSGRYPVHGRKDILFVYVKLLDKLNTLCVYDNDSQIHLKIEGGNIISPERVISEAGIATFLISTGENAEILLNAETEAGFRSGYKIKL